MLGLVDSLWFGRWQAKIKSRGRNFSRENKINVHEKNQKCQTRSFSTHPSIMSLTNYILAAIPLLFPAWIVIDTLEDPWTLASRWSENFFVKQRLQFSSDDAGDIALPSVSSQLIVYSVMGTFGYILTNRLVPKIKVRACIFIPGVVTTFPNNVG